VLMIASLADSTIAASRWAPISFSAEITAKVLARL
jgi:hypothetical protein